jgi:hypothetical protein
MKGRRQSLITHRFVLSVFVTATALLFCQPGVGAVSPVPVNLSLAADWVVKVSLPAHTEGNPATKPIETLIQIPRNAQVTINAERHDSLPLFNPKAFGWVKGDRLRALCAQEATTRFLLDPASLALRAAPETHAESFRAGEDFEADFQWGTVGRNPEGRIKEGQPVFISYRYAPLRLDAIVLTRAGQIVLRVGQSCISGPKPPSVATNEIHLGNVWIPGYITNLNSENLFPILESAFPKPAKASPVAAEKFVPRAMKNFALASRCGFSPGATVSRMAASCLTRQPNAGRRSS